jgi:hypothetical protein
MTRRRRTQATAARSWRQAASGAAEDARIARDALDDAVAGDSDPARMQTLHSQVDAVGSELTRLAASAPDDASRTRVRGVDESLRAYLLAVDNEQFLRQTAGTPVGQSIADATAARHARAGALEHALTQLAEVSRTEE